jgi:hypothetical protein
LSVTLTRVAVDALKKAAMLEEPLPLASVPVASSAVKTKSSKVTPFVPAPVTCSALPVTVGATVVGVDALYAHVVQSSPP